MTQAAAKESAGLQVGDAAPNFDMASDKGGQVTLKDFKGQNVVLYFYPKDDTPGCTIEAKDFRDLAQEFAKAETILIGVSKDSIDSHCKFSNKFDLNFALASDEDGDVCERYGVWGEKNMYGKKYMGITRATFFIDKQGKIAQVWPKVSVDGHAKEVLEAAKKLG